MPTHRAPTHPWSIYTALVLRMWHCENSEQEGYERCSINGAIRVSERFFNAAVDG